MSLEPKRLTSQNIIIMNIHKAIHFVGETVEDIFRLPCVTSIRKGWPNAIFVTVLCYDGEKRVVRKGDWIVESNRGWNVLTNQEYKALRSQ